VWIIYELNLVLSAEMANKWQVGEYQEKAIATAVQN
jgi:hypothetical protein